MIYPGRNQYPERVIQTLRNFHQGFPWSGYDGGVGLASSNAAFNPAFKVYGLPLSDMSRPQKNHYTNFDNYVDEFRSKFRIGDYLQAIIINNHHNQDEENVGVVGRLCKYIIDNENMRLRIFVISDIDNQVYEVYPETIINKDRIQENLMIKLKNYYML